MGALPNELSVEYRSCATLKTHIALSAVLKGATGFARIHRATDDCFQQKTLDHATGRAERRVHVQKSRGVPAGKLIDDLHLKGTRVGGAFVSAEHGNFLVNDGTATARDVLGAD